MLPGLLDVHDDVGKDAQSVVVPARHEVAEPNVVVQTDLAGRHSGVGQDLHGKENRSTDMMQHVHIWHGTAAASVQLKAILLL